MKNPTYPYDKKTIRHKESRMFHCLQNEYYFSRKVHMKKQTPYLSIASHASQIH